MKPSDFKKHPYDSVFQNTETEIVARNIMVILWRTGDKFRPLSWEEYERERMKDGSHTVWQEKPFFEMLMNWGGIRDQKNFDLPGCRPQELMTWGLDQVDEEKTA